MKRIFTWVCALAIVLQLFLPQLIYAIPTDKTLTLADITIKNQDALPTNEIDAALQGAVKTGNELRNVKVTLSDNVLLVDESGELKDLEQQVIGSYVMHVHEIVFTINPEVDAKLAFSFKGQLEETDAPKVTIDFDVDGEKVAKEMTFEVPDPEIDVVTPTLEEKPAKDVGKKLQLKRATVDIKDLMGPTDEFLTGMNVTYTDGDGNPVTNPTIKDNVNFEMAFDLPESVREQMQDGDYYTFTLPDEIKIVQNQSFPLKNANDETYATAVVNVDGTVTITFNERVTKESDIHGDFNFSGKFDEVAIPGPGDITIVIPGEEQIPGVGVTVRPDVASSVSKEGHFDKTPNPNQVIWNVDVNKDMNHITNATVTENLPDGLTIIGVKVYELQVDFDGNVISGSTTEIPTSEYTVDADGKVIFSNAIDKPYRIEYTTDIDSSVKPGNEGGAVKFTNDVTFDGDEIASIPAEASVTGNYKAGLVKGQPNYHPEDQTFDWVINYNHNEFNIKETQATVHDTITGNMTLQDDSVVLKKVTFDSNGNAQEGDTLVLGVDYNLFPAPDGKGFEIAYIGDVDYAVNIHYTTQVEDVIDQDTMYGNSVEDGSGNTDTESGTAKQQGLIKNIENVDYGSKTLNWVVDINKNNYQMENWTFTDTLSEGLTWVNLRFSIIDVTTGLPLQQGVDYTMTYDTTTNQIRATFIGSYVSTSDTFKVIYLTEFDADVLEQSGETAFKNNATSDWVSTTDNTHKNPGDTAEFKPNPASQDNGFKFGDYNATDKLITWTLGVNYSKVALENAQVVDKMTDNQNFVPGSLKIFHYSIASDGSYVKGAELTSEERAEFIVTEPADGNDKTLTIDLPDVNSSLSQYMFEYQTSLVGEVIHESNSYTNTATVKNDGHPDYDISGKVSVTHGGSYAEKTGVQDADGYVNWDVMINPSQSTLNNVVVSDNPSTNQAIDEDSVLVYTTSIDPSGQITRGAPLDSSLYEVVLTTDNLTGLQHLEVRFNGEITASYELVYRSVVFLDENATAGKVSNDITVKGDNIETVTGEESKEVNVSVSNGGGTAVGTKGQVTLHKIDDAGTRLTGAKFELWNQANTTVLREGFVDANGTITFGALPYGTYLLKETQAPEGVSISTELKNGKPLQITTATSAPVAFTDIVNERSTVELSKKTEDNANLAGATFKLEHRSGNTWTRIRANETFISNQAGKLVVRGLDEGTYRFTEIKAPTAPKSYILNTTPVEFTVTKDANGVIASQTVGPVINYLGDISFKKVAEGGTTGLAGAVFKVTRVADETGAVVNQVITTTLTSSADGSVQLTGLAPGRYTLQETKAPTGYILNTKVQSFTIAASQAGNPDTVVLPNQVNYKGSIQFMKTDENHQGLQGAEFEIRKFVGNELIQTVTSEGTGRVSATNLAPGIYKLVETKAPDGYILNTANHFFTISAKANGLPQTVTVGEIINYQGSVALTKVNGQGERLAGAEYTLYNDADVELGVYTSGKTGSIKIDDLSPGDYKLVETKAPLQSNGESYVLNKYPASFTINASQNGAVKELNLGQYQNFKGIVKLTKTGGSQSLSGAVFDLYKFGQDQPIKQVISDDSGQIDYGDVGPGYYKLIETKAPNSFIINKNPIYFVVAESGGENQVIDRGIFENFQASIEFNKTDEDGKQLTTAVFELMQVRDVEGNQVNKSLTKELKANEEGVYHFDGLAPGKYEVKEVRAPDGYILNTKPQTFEITTEFMNNPGTIKLADFVNYKGSAMLSKVNEKNQGLVGVSFELTNDATKETASFQTDEAGKLVMDNLDPGKYTLTETKAQAGYILNTKPVTFTIARTESGKPEQVALGTFVNYKGSAVLTKVDAGNKAKKLTGTQFKLIDEAGKMLKLGLKTDKMGQIIVQDLSPGKYAFLETKASTGYQLTGEKYDFTVKDKQQGIPKVISIQVENKKVLATGGPTSSANNSGATGKGSSNGKDGVLPETGDTDPIYLLIVGILLLGIGILLFKPKKRDE